MIKILIFAVFFVMGTLAGICVADKLRQYRDTAHEIHAMLDHISVLVRYRGLDVYEICSELKNSDSYRHLNFIEKLPTNFVPGENFHELWRDSVTCESGIGSDENKCLVSFGNVLGTSDTDGQISAIETVIESIKLIEHRRDDEFRQKNRLYRSVGMLFGTMAGNMYI